MTSRIGTWCSNWGCAVCMYVSPFFERGRKSAREMVLPISVVCVCVVCVRVVCARTSTLDLYVCSGC